MKKYSIEMLLHQGTITTYLEISTTPDGSLYTRDKDAAIEALAYWRRTQPKFQFQLTEWTPRLLSEA